MKKLLLAFPIVILLAARCHSSQQASVPTQTPVAQNINTTGPASTSPNSTQVTSPTTTPASNPILATPGSLIAELQNNFGQLGYKIGTSSPANLWWLDTSGIAIDVHTANEMNFEITDKAQTDYDVPSMKTAPEIAKVITAVNSYMGTKNFVIQQNQSTTDANPHLEYFTYTNAYYNSQNNIRCRLEINDPYSGVGETPPYPFVATILCMDNQQYSDAYNQEAPFMQGLAQELSSTTITTLQQMVNPKGIRVCNGDPLLTIILLDAVSGTEAGWAKAMLKTDKGWVDVQMSPYEINMHCESNPIVKAPGNEVEYLFANGTFYADNKALTLHVTSFSDSQISIDITDEKTGQSQSVSMKQGDSISLFGHKLNLDLITTVQNSSGGQAWITPLAMLSVIRE